MLSAYEDLWDVHVPAPLLQPLLQLLVVELVDVDVLGHDADSKVVEQVLDVATVFERRADPAEAGDVDHHLSSLRVQL